MNSGLIWLWDMMRAGLVCGCERGDATIRYSLHSAILCHANVGIYLEGEEENGREDVRHDLTLRASFKSELEFLYGYDV